jgi:hypothetical protein
MTQTKTTAISKALELLIEYGVVSPGSHDDDMILVGVSTLINHMIAQNRKLIDLENQIFQYIAMEEWNRPPTPTTGWTS